MHNYDTPVYKPVHEICDEQTDSLDTRDDAKEIVEKLATDAMFWQIIEGNYGNETKEDQ
jgi:hypothetical protein